MLILKGKDCSMEPQAKLEYPWIQHLVHAANDLDDAMIEAVLNMVCCKACQQHDCACVISPVGELMCANNNYINTFRLEPGMSIYKVIPRHERKHLEENFFRVTESRVPGISEHLVESSNGIVHYRWINRPIVGETGAVEYIQSFGACVTPLNFA